MSRVEICYSDCEPEPGVNLRIKHRDASLQDLLMAWQPLCDDENIFKSYAEGNHSLCKGCRINCCNTAYVIPDIISFKKMSHHLKLDYQEFLNTYFQKDKMDVGLPRMKSDPCIFLKDNICTIYPIRSLICRFYICAELTGPVEQFIYSLTWTGITATILFAEKHNLLKFNSKAGLTSMDLMFKRLTEEYRGTPNVELFMKAEEYADIPLMPFMDDYTRVLAKDI